MKHEANDIIAICLAIMHSEYDVDDCIGRSGVSRSEDCDNIGAVYNVDSDDFASGVVFLIFLAE